MSEPCKHPQTFFRPLAASAAAVFGCDACLTCGAGQPPFDRGTPIPVPGIWRAIRTAK